MQHFGLICPPGSSHVAGLTGIARALMRRGHSATVFNILDVEPLATREGVNFRPLGVEQHPAGSFKAFSEKFSQLHGLEALRYGLKVALEEITMLLDEAPAAMRAAGVTAIIADQGQPAASSIAEHLGIPFITICNAVPMDPDPAVPLSATTWGPATNTFERMRNRLVYRTFDLSATPMRRAINRFRSKWGLAPLRSLYDTFSPYLELSQQSPEFDFPRPGKPAQFHHIGLIRRTASSSTPFPFDRLDGRPVVYGSIGTVRSDDQNLFGKLAEACAALDVQLVLTLGGKGDPAALSHLPGSPLVAVYVPQLAVLERTAVTVCHSGNNTVLESLAAGVPVLAVPMNGDQYGVAARVKHSGAGDFVTLKELTADRLQADLRRLLTEPSYRRQASIVRASLERAGGEERAAELIERTLVAA